MPHGEVIEEGITILHNFKIQFYHYLTCPIKLISQWIEMFVAL